MFHRERKDRALMRRVLAALIFLALVSAGSAYGKPPFPCHETPSHGVEAIVHDHVDHAGREHYHCGKSPCCDVGCAVCLAIIPGQVASRAFSGVSPLVTAATNVLVGTPLPPILGPPKAELES